VSGRHARPMSRRSFLAVCGAVVAAGLAGLARAVWPGPRTHLASTASPPARIPASPAPSAVPPPTPTPSPSRQGLVIHGAGDTNLDPSVITTLRTHGYDYAWSGMHGLFQRDDLTIVNCECAVSTLGMKVPGKSFNFRGDPAALPAMRTAGVDVANLGNNHAYDFGPTALLDSRKNLLANGIAPVGAGKDPAAANAPALFEVKGWTIAVVGFDKVVDPFPEAVAAPGHPGTADGHDENRMVAAVRAAKRDADLVIVAIHWGVELDTQPRPDDVLLGRRLVDAGADVIFGGHAHRLQPVGTHGDRPIFYSLGNFVWQNLSVAGSTTAVAEVRVTPQGKVVPKLLPAYIQATGHPVLV
jgi:capsule synthesis protein PGA_cap